MKSEQIYWKWSQILWAEMFTKDLPWVHKETKVLGHSVPLSLCRSTQEKNQGK